MKFIYPAVIEKNEKGYHAYFPDLAMCEADGETMDDVIRNARDAMFNWIDLELSEDDPQLPGLENMDAIVVPEGAELRNIMINYRFHSGWDE